MASASEILTHLKTILRRRRITYKSLGEDLGLSESSVKRMFSRGDMPLIRLQEICRLAGIDIAMLAIDTVEVQRSLTQLSEQQEKMLVEEPRFLLFAYLLVSGWSYQDILAKYKFTAPEATLMLVKLDRMKLIELLPDNRVRLRIANNFHWREAGPISRFFDQQVQKEFLNADFSRSGSLKLANNGYVSQSSLNTLHRRIESLSREFAELSQQDAKQPKNQLLPVTMVAAIRPWVFSAFQQFARD